VRPGGEGREALKETPAAKENKEAVVNHLRAALNELEEAHRICFQNLFPTWQVVDNKIEARSASINELLDNIHEYD
jgi:hypothetical protein